MNSLLGRILSLLVLGAGMMSGYAQADVPGPYYATPSWDQTLPSATRFIVLSNFAGAAVLDRNTGLVWEKSPTASTQAWSNARSTCIDKNVGGQKGWRLPSIPELGSLVDPSVASPGPTLPPGHPFTNVQSGGYWSASTSAEDRTLAWSVSFFIGLTSNVSFISKTGTGRAWCVRGGGPLSEY